MDNINAKLDAVRLLLNDENFLLSKGLSNAMNVRICDYNAKDEMAVRYFIENLNKGIDLPYRAIIFNLYEIFISICRDKRILDKVDDLEIKKGSQYTLEQLRRVANNEDYLDRMEYSSYKEGDVIVITGVGEAFPFISVSSLLESIQSIFSGLPIIVMYPGEFNGTSLRLFNKLKRNSYYRAFQII